ncbi:MAG: hypothetical protein ABIJ27_01365 [Candidatus Omnitrophota bacterium]
MANKYYYLVASMPYLAFAAANFPSEEEFLAECEKWLSLPDMAALAQARMSGFSMEQAATELLKAWKEFDTNARAELADAHPLLKAQSKANISETAREIYAKETPLAMERRFERSRWDFLDEKEREYHFDLQWLIIYYLKIKILTRLAGFEQTKGINAFSKVCEVAL